MHFCLPESEKRVIISPNLVTNRDDCMQLFYFTRQEEAFSYGLAGFSFLFVQIYNPLRSGFIF